jgi:predicted transposase/invertase (TIGR01784 family)
MSNPRVILPTQDLCFKKLTCSLEHRDIPQGLVHDWFGLHVDQADITPNQAYSIHLIDDIDVNDEAAVAKFCETMRDVTLDLKVADAVLEFQVKKEAFHLPRQLYYLCDRYTSHYLPGSQRYTTLRPVYMLALAGFRLFDGPDGYRLFQLQDTLRPHGEILKDLTLGVAEYKKTRFQSREQAMWCEFFRTGIAPKGAPDYIVAASKLVSYANMDRKERRMIDLMEKHESDLLLRMNNVRAEGRAEERATWIRAMLADGFAVDDIARLARLSVDEVLALPVAG